METNVSKHTQRQCKCGSIVVSTIRGMRAVRGAIAGTSTSQRCSRCSAPPRHRSKSLRSFGVDLSC